MSKKKQQLDLSEVKELLQVQRELFSHISSLKNSRQIAEYIEWPKVPAPLTQSIVVHCIAREWLIPELEGSQHPTFGIGQRNPDVIHVNALTNRETSIQVKGTGRGAFTELGEKDIEAEYLIWVHFGEYFLPNGSNKIEIYTLRDPKRHFSKRTKILLEYFKTKTRTDLIKNEIDLVKLTDSSKSS